MASECPPLPSANQHVRDILALAIGHTPEHAAVVVSDAQSGLARILTHAYRACPPMISGRTKRIGQRVRDLLQQLLQEADQLLRQALTHPDTSPSPGGSWRRLGGRHGVDPGQQVARALFVHEHDDDPLPPSIVHPARKPAVGWLRAEGAWIVGEDGKTVRLTGVVLSNNVWGIWINGRSEALEKAGKDPMIHTERLLPWVLTDFDLSIIERLRGRRKKGGFRPSPRISECPII